MQKEGNAAAALTFQQEEHSSKKLKAATVDGCGLALLKWQPSPMECECRKTFPQIVNNCTLVQSQAAQAPDLPPCPHSETAPQNHKHAMESSAKAKFISLYTRKTNAPLTELVSPIIQCRVLVMGLLQDIALIISSPLFFSGLFLELKITWCCVFWTNSLIFSSTFHSLSFCLFILLAGRDTQFYLLILPLIFFFSALKALSCSLNVPTLQYLILAKCIHTYPLICVYAQQVLSLLQLISLCFLYFLSCLLSLSFMFKVFFKCPSAPIAR